MAAAARLVRTASCAILPPMRGPLPALLIVLLASAWLPAEAQSAPKAPTAKQIKAQAQQVNEQAKEAFRAGQWDRAAELFLQVYDLAKLPTAVYNAARAREQGGKLMEAKALFELFLSIEKSPAGQQDGRKRIAELEEKLNREAQEKARAEAEAKAKAEAEEKLRQAEARAREAEQREQLATQKVREAEMLAQKEKAAKAEVEAKLRAETEARGRAEAEQKAQSAEARALDAEKRAREAEARAKLAGKTDPAAAGQVKPGAESSAAGVGSGLKPGAAPGVAAVPHAQSPEIVGESTILFGVIPLLSGGASLQQGGPAGDLQPDLSLGAGGQIYLAWGARNRAPAVAVVAGAQKLIFQGFGAPTPAAKPSGTDFWMALAFPRLSGLQATLHRNAMELNNGRGQLNWTTAGAKVVVSPNYGYFSLGVEGLVGSDRRDLDVNSLDEFGYGPLFRLVLELGLHFGTAALSK